VIEAVGLCPSAAGPWTPAIVIRVHEGSTQEVQWGEPQDIDAMSPADIVKAVQATGMVGLGGAAFPSHLKLAVPDGAKAHTLVINGCECEPYLTCDHRVMMEYGKDLMLGIRYAMRATGAERTIIGIEDNKPEAVAALRALLPAGGNIFVEALQTKYPQGGEKMLIKSLFGVEIPAGELPISQGLVMLNVGTAAALGKLLPLGQGLLKRVVTLTGPGVAKPGNYLMPIGTPLSFVLDYAGVPATAHQITLGGPMMGQAVASLEVPITKGVSGVLVFTGDDLAGYENRKVYPCIKCGECVAVCPMGLNPSQLGLLAVKREYQTMGEEFHIGDCFECGCCTYVCPSNIPLVQQFRVAKTVLREEEQAK